MKAFIELYRNDVFVQRYTKDIMDCVRRGYKPTAKMYYRNLLGALKYIWWNTDKINNEEIYEFCYAMDRWIEAQTGERHFSWDC